MTNRTAIALLAFSMGAPLCIGSVTFDLTTAVLTLDDRGIVTSLKFADGNERSAPGRPAFSLGTDSGLHFPDSVTLSADRLTVAFSGGSAAEFFVSRHRGFALFELTKFAANEQVERFQLFGLPVPKEGELATTLNACYVGASVACVMAAEPNVCATTDNVGAALGNLDGCRHEFAPADKDVKVGRQAARFTATSTLKDASGWSIRGKTFPKPLDLSGCKAVRAWVRGDAKCELLKIQLYDGAGGYRDNYFTIDFDGWKQVTLTDCPINSLHYDRVACLNFYYNALPPEQTVTCLIDQVEAVVERDGKEQVILLEDFESPDSPLWGTPAISLTAQTVKRYGIQPARFAVIACPADQFLDTIQRFESAARLPSPHPGGVWSKLSPWAKRSYFFLTSFRESQFDEALAIARRGGFHTILMGQESWCKSTGHYDVNTNSFPDGIEGLKRTIHRFREAGFRVGLHFLGASIYPPDPYLTPVPDPRLVKDAFTTLAADIDDKSDVLATPTAPDAFPAEDGGYMGGGTVLQIGDELIQYGVRSTKPPFGFLQCRRGHLGTKPTAHKKGDKVSHLMRAYGYHLHDMDTSLLDEVAGNFARTANACEVDMLYFDGSEWLQGDHWYYNARLHKAFYDKLNNKDMLIQASSHSHYSWHIMTRNASADGHGDLKGYLDQRSGWFDVLARNHMPLDVGWYYGYDPTATPDMFEYVLGATIGYDSSMSFQVSPDAAAAHPFTPQILDLIARYEELRLSGRVPLTVRQHLRIDPALTGKDVPSADLARRKRCEYRLLGPKGSQVFQRVFYEPWHDVTAIDDRSNVWPVPVMQGLARIGLQIHATGGPWTQPGPSYHAADALTLETFDDLAPYAGDPTKPTGIFLIEPGKAGSVLPGVTQRFESIDKDARQGPRCALYSATSSLPASNGWSVIGKVFNPPLDLSWHKGIGLWLRGDGNGGAFKLQLRDAGPGAVDYYIENNYAGWRYHQLARPDKDPIDYAKLVHLMFYYNGLPAKTTVTCGIDDVKALRCLDQRTVVNPSVEIAGNRVSYPGTLTEGQFVTIWPDEPITINGGHPAQTAPSTQNAPSLSLPAGEYPARFTLSTPLLMTVRARLTFQPPEQHSL